MFGFQGRLGGCGGQVSKRVRGQEGVSLSLMAEACLGKPLDKSMQLSRWATRPLTQRQLTYAGMAAAEWGCTAPPVPCMHACMHALLRGACRMRKSKKQ